MLTRFPFCLFFFLLGPPGLSSFPEGGVDISSTHPSRDVFFFGQISAKKPQDIISVHDVWEPLKQEPLASRDVIISSQICVLKFQKFFSH